MEHYSLKQNKTDIRTRKHIEHNFKAANVVSFLINNYIPTFYKEEETKVGFRIHIVKVQDGEDEPCNQNHGRPGEPLFTKYMSPNLIALKRQTCN